MSDKRPDESWEDLAERRIRAAQLSGEFDNLPGFGQPIPGIDETLDENWWIKAKLRREQLVVMPPIMEARLAKERFLESLATFATESAVRDRIAAVNEQIRKAHFSHIAGPPDGVLPLEEQQVITEWNRIRTHAMMKQSRPPVV